MAGRTGRGHRLSQDPPGGLVCGGAPLHERKWVCHTGRVDLGEDGRGEAVGRAFCGGDI